MIKGPEIYSKDNLGRIRSWQYVVEGDAFSIITGIIGKKLTTSKPKKCKAKSQASAEEQALFEAEAAMTKKLRIDYHDNLADAREYGPKVFLPQLSQPYEDLKEPITEGWSQPKFDGIRSCITRHRMTQEPGAYSREGVRQKSFDFVVDEVLAYLHGEFAFDGEFYNHDYKDNFNKITSLVRTEKDADIEKLKKLITHHTYDIYLPGMGFSKRLEYMESLFKEGAFRHLELAETVYFNNEEERDDLYAEYLQDGYEGQILRTPEGDYQTNTRSFFSIKRKTFITEEFNIKRLEEGTGNWAGAVARVIVDLPNGKECETGIDGNFAFRAKLLKEKDDYVDGTATVRFLNWTPDGKLRGGVTKDIVKGERED